MPNTELFATFTPAAESIQQHEYPSTLKSVPEQWKRLVQSYFLTQDKSALDMMSGLDSNADSYLVFHGTKRDRVNQIIASGGMKAFDEPGRQDKARIFGTMSPSMAIWHTEENGPNDSLRKAQGDMSSHKQQESVLLIIRLPKEWLRNHPQAILPRSLPAYMKRQLGITGDKDSRIAAFEEVMQSEISSIKQVKEPTDFGVPLPVTVVPLEYISEVHPDGSVTPLVQTSDTK